MTHGGRRNGTGRPKGAISLSTRVLLEAAISGGETPIGRLGRAAVRPAERNLLPVAEF
jgi:hypothetical protein